MNRVLKLSVFTFLFAVLTFGISVADQKKEDCEKDMTPYTGSAEFEKIKSLSGTWTGTGIMNGEEVPMTVDYRTTSGGSAVIETFSPGTPMEMVSIYYEDEGKLVMKHFCMLKNQPLMGLKSSDGNTMEFDLIGGTNMDASKDMHMHSSAITILDDNTLKQSWTAYQDGKQIEGDGTVTLTRAQ